jgi:hypothetical protein
MVRKTALRQPAAVQDRDLWLYALSFHEAARKLAGALEPGPGPFAEVNASPVVFMYRHAIELHLKAIVLGDGGNFLPTKPDALSVHKTHSISWLAQFVYGIVRALKWEHEFRCNGIENLAEFKAVIESVSSVDPGSYVFRDPTRAGQDPATVDHVAAAREFARRMDAVIELLAATADGLAAEWDLRSNGTWDDDEPGGGSFGPTTQ